MDKPTQEQIKEFWEWCGVPEMDIFINKPFSDMIPIDLNNLFKYAVPKLQEEGYAILLCDSQGKLPYHAEIYRYDDSGDEDIFKHTTNDDPALALFWTLWQVKEDKGL